MSCCVLFVLDVFDGIDEHVYVSVWHRSHDWGSVSDGDLGLEIPDEGGVNHGIDIVPCVKSFKCHCFLQFRLRVGGGCSGLDHIGKEMLPDLALLLPCDRGHRGSLCFKIKRGVVYSSPGS